MGVILVLRIPICSWMPAPRGLDRDRIATSECKHQRSIFNSHRHYSRAKHTARVGWPSPDEFSIKLLSSFAEYNSVIFDEV